MTFSWFPPQEDFQDDRKAISNYDELVAKAYEFAKEIAPLYVHGESSEAFMRTASFALCEAMWAGSGLDDASQYWDDSPHIECEGTLPAKGVHCVYAIQVRKHPRRWHLEYVGVSSNLKKRIATHRNKWIRHHYKSHISWSTYETRAEANDAERRAIARLKPSRNIQGVGAR